MLPRKVTFSKNLNKVKWHKKYIFMKQKNARIPIYHSLTITYYGTSEVPGKILRALEIVY